LKIFKKFETLIRKRQTIRRTFRLSTNLDELTTLTTGRKSLIKQQILVYETAVYTLVNGVITDTKANIKKWYCSAGH